MSELSRREWQHKHQGFERGWWGDCCNTYGEETKQIAYARVMGLEPGEWQAGNPWPVYDLSGRRVIDIGGGPVSMLLKCTNLGPSTVVDPCAYPAWTAERYAVHGIGVGIAPAEDYLDAVDQGAYDEAWCYNVLQHVHDPERIVAGMRQVAPTIRIFEWIETAAYLGHPHELHADELERWVGGEGRTVTLDEQYVEITSGDNPHRVEQLAWGGVFAS